MANGIVMDQGLADYLSDLIAGGNFSTQKCRLYQNNHVPANTDVIGNYTESTFTGYAAVTVAGWSAPVVAGHVGSTVASTITFTLTAGTQNVYGAYLTNAGNTRLYAAQVDPNAPVVLNTTVTVYQVTITFTDQSL